MPPNSYPAEKLPRTWAGDIQISGKNSSTDLRRKPIGASIPTVTTTGDQEIILIAPADGTITSVRVAFKDALAAHDTNYVDFSAINKGQAGAGTDVVIDGTLAANTTKITGGTALAAYGMRSLTMTGGVLTVLRGDVIAFKVTHHGTLANTLTEGHVSIHISGLG